MEIDLNTTSSSNHVLDIESKIIIIKDRARACHHTLPFKHTPKVILVAILIKCIL